jgi:hypothetical protein
MGNRFVGQGKDGIYNKLGAMTTNLCIAKSDSSNHDPFDILTKSSDGAG